MHSESELQSEPMVIVRPASTEDIFILVDMIRTMALESEDRALDTDTLQSGVKAVFEQQPHLGTYWLGVLPDTQETIANLLITTEWSDWNNTFYWWIQSMFIKPEYRGKGYITRMLRAVEEEAQKAGVAELRLYAHKLNDRAIKAYKKSGFFDNRYMMMSKRLDGSTEES